MAKGKLLVTEGLDSSGKSTQVKLIKEYFNNNNLKHVHYHFPMYGHNQFSTIIANYLKGDFGNIDEVDPLFVANIYAMDRFRFLPELEKSLEENDVVLLDRYVYSNIAYQCAKYNKPDDILKMKNWIFEFEFGFLKLPYPDLNIFLNVSIEVIKKRLKEQRIGKDRDYLQGKQDIHEANLEFQEKVKENYENFMENATNCIIVNCAYEVGYKTSHDWIVLSPEELFNSYKKYLDNIILNK
jgi:dTMP kinase